MSDRVAIIHEGRKVAEGLPSELRSQAGDNQVVEMEVGVQRETATAALNAHPIVDRILSVREDANTATVRFRTKQPLRSVGEVSLEDRLSGVPVRSVQLVQPTLEDAFIAVTGSSISEAGDVE